MKNQAKKMKALIISHKILSLIILVAIISAGYFILKSLTSITNETQYVMASVQRGTIISSVSASGQIESSNQIDLKADATGKITYVGVKPGDLVKKGKTLFGLDAREAEKKVRDAKNSLETAQLDLDKFQEAPNSVDVLTIKQAIADAETSKKDASKQVEDAYTTFLNTSLSAISNNATDTQTPPTISGTYTKGKEVKIIITFYQTGNGAYFSTSSEPSGIVEGTGQVSTVVPQPIGDSGLYIKFANSSSNQPNWLINIPNKTATNYNTNYIAYQNAIDNQKKANDAADLSIAQNNQKLTDLYQPDALTLRTKQLAVKQAEDNLLDAKQALSDYYVVAPFDGTAASVTGKIGDIASGSLGTLITNQKIATLSMNEVDVSKIKLGQKATITFDAIDNLSLTGTVVEIDTVGTVSQGVVSYNVKLAFDADDSRVKPGMSVSASIITDSKTDVLYVPSSAIKNLNNTKYILTFSSPLPAPQPGSQGVTTKESPEQVTVDTGITDDTNTEIVSGLKEGDQIVARTITTSTATKTSSSSILGGNRTSGGGGNFMIR